jgi:DNA repair protein RadD
MLNYKFNQIELRPEYQQPIHDVTIAHCKESNDPAFISASVGAGKTVNIGAIAAHVSGLGGRVLVIARTGELVAQNSAMAWKMGVKNSTYSASLNTKSTFYPVIFASEKTLCKALDAEFKDMAFNIILIDECHMVNDEEAADALKATDTSELSQYAKIIAHFVGLNKKTKIIGYTGSPYRGKKDILGTFWKKKLYDVSTMWLVSIGYLVPPVFGFGDDAHKYDLSEWTPSQNAECGSDFSGTQLSEMQKAVTKDKQKTQIIMEEVVSICSNRSGGVMITCAGRAHCEQVAEFLPLGSYAIVTEKTSNKARAKALIDARTGDIKYILQVGCLTVGVNVPPWSTSVILRRIGSLTLLTQLTGRILRILEQEDIDNGFEKTDGLILDYTDTFESFGDIYDDPLLEQARAHKSTYEGTPQECPICSTQNSEFAVRCIGHANNDDGRCEHFFQSSMCFKCDTHNAPSARNCRKCNAILIDPAKALRNKHYNESDYKEVLGMNWSKTKQGDGVFIEYWLNSIYTANGIENQEVAKEYFKPFSTIPHEKQRWKAFVGKSINGHKFKSIAMQARTVGEIVQNKAIFDRPTHITHRVNDKGFSIINRRKFLSGREAI